MKKIIYLFAICTVSLFMGCNNDPDLQSENKSQEILAFNNFEEFDSTLQEVIKMNDDERIRWGKENKFRSFGSISDSIYNSVNPDQFTSMEAIEAFVAKNSNYIELVTDDYGEISCVPKEENNSNRYLMNKDLMYIIATDVYKQLDDKLIYTEIVNKSKLLAAKSINDTYSFKTDVVTIHKDMIKAASPVQKVKDGKKNAEDHEVWHTVDKNRIMLWISTFLIYNKTHYKMFRQNEYTVKNQKRTLYVWFNAGRSTSFKIWFQSTGNYEPNKGATPEALIMTYSKEKINDSFARDNNYNGGFVNLEGENFSRFEPSIIDYDCWARNGSGCYVTLKKNK